MEIREKVNSSLHILVDKIVKVSPDAKLVKGVNGGEESRTHRNAKIGKKVKAGDRVTISEEARLGNNALNAVASDTDHIDPKSIRKRVVVKVPKNWPGRYLDDDEASEKKPILRDPVELIRHWDDDASEKCEDVCTASAGFKHGEAGRTARKCKNVHTAPDTDCVDPKSIRKRVVVKVPKNWPEPEDRGW